MTITLRVLVIILAILLLLVALLLCVWRVGLPARPQPTPTGVPSARSETVATAGQTITFQDESLGWDWTADCAAQFSQFLAAQLPGQPIRSVKIVLVDHTPDRKLPFGVRYGAAKTIGDCYAMRAGDFTCYTAIAEGEPDPGLDVVVATNAAYTLLDMFLARGPDPNAIRATWSWATLQPLVIPAKEPKQWASACLHVTRAR